MSKDNKKIRYTVDFPPAVMKTLEGVAGAYDLSKADVLRQAIALFAYVNKEVSVDNERHLSITNGKKILKDIVLLSNTVTI